MRKFKFEFEWTIQGAVAVEAETPEKALHKLNQQIVEKLDPHLHSHEFHIYGIREMVNE